MLSFSELQNCQDERAVETVDFYREQAEDGSLCLYQTICHDCLLLMGKDEDGTVFFPPEALSEDADVSAALDEVDIFAGAVCEERIFVGLDEEWEDFFALRYPQHEITDMGDGFSGFRVLTELHRLQTVPKIEGDKISLSLPTETDGDFYRLLAEETENSLYGYRHAGENLLEEVKREWESRKTLPLVISDDGKPVGEVTLFSFDGRKGAEIAIRIAETFRNRGYGRETLREMIAFSRDVLHLSTLRAEVKIENLPSLSLFAEFFQKKSEENGIVLLERNL